MSKDLENKKEFKEFKQVAGMSSKPSYLKKPKENIRALIVIGIMLIVMCIVNPYLLIAMPFYLVWSIIQFKQYRSEENRLLEDAICYFEVEKYDQCMEQLNMILESEPKNEKANIISALIKYDKEEYEEVIQLLSNISSKVLDNDLDLQIKLADCYVRVGKNENAKGLYEKLSKITGKSDFIKEAINKLE